MNSLVLKPWRWVATFFRTSTSAGFLTGGTGAFLGGAARSAAFLMAVTFLTGATRAVDFLLVMRRVTFLLGRERPCVFALGGARRALPRETDGFRLAPELFSPARRVSP